MGTPGITLWASLTATASTPCASPTATASTPTAPSSTPTASTPQLQVLLRLRQRQALASASTPTASSSTPTATASTPTATASTPIRLRQRQVLLRQRQVLLRHRQVLLYGTEHYFYGKGKYSYGHSKYFYGNGTFSGYVYGSGKYSYGNGEKWFLNVDVRAPGEPCAVPVPLHVLSATPAEPSALLSGCARQACPRHHNRYLEQAAAARQSQAASPLFLFLLSFPAFPFSALYSALGICACIGASFGCNLGFELLPI